MEYDRIFTGFGFSKEDKKRKLSTFSGGEKTKIALIRLLLMKPDLLLLDEPTNHLDIQTVEWLEEYMRHYEKAVIFVSHDRFFLDRVVDVVYELKDGHLKRYPGNYTAYRKARVKELEAGQKAYERQQEELKRLNELIERFKNKPKKAAFARSRKKIMERMEKIEKPDEDDVHIFTGALEPQIPGSKWVLEAEHLKIGYDKVLLELSLRIRKGQKIAVIGDNGVGKSTFLKTAAGLMEPLDGKCTLGNRTMLGYFDQHSAELTSEKTVVEHFHDLFPAMTEKDVRQTLGAYLFPGAAASTVVSRLSGGERARLVLAELLSARPNFLVLDEPTNHMDVQARETLESAFLSYRGTILFVSHDRYFVSRVADAILVFENGEAMFYPFGYEHYLKRKNRGDAGELSALIRAEDQALVEGLRAVPKGERRFTREISSDQAYLEWQLRLRQEQMEQKRDRVEVLSLRMKQQMEERCIAWADSLTKLKEIEETEGASDSQESVMESPEKTLKEAEDAWNRLQEEMLAAEEEWTESCLAWMEIWEELHPEIGKSDSGE
jgi:ATP-binding cassette subfamily F protein 3